MVVYLKSQRLNSNSAKAVYQYGRWSIIISFVSWICNLEAQFRVLGMQSGSSVLGLGYATCMMIVASTILKTAIYEDLVAHVFLRLYTEEGCSYLRMSNTSIIFFNGIALANMLSLSLSSMFLQFWSICSNSSWPNICKYILFRVPHQRNCLLSYFLLNNRIK